MLPLLQDIVINPMADGRCFWSCLFLHSSSALIKRDWADQKRSEQGFPEPDRATAEKNSVYRFVNQILKVAALPSDSEQFLWRQHMHM